MPFSGPHASANNGMIRCYNLFPSYFKNIQEMTEYLDYLAELNVNVVWLNPIQFSSQLKLEKADMLTAQNQDLKGSLYAMIDPTLIDPRFSMVQRDEDGDMALTAEQKQEAPSVFSEQLVAHTKYARHELLALSEQITKREKEFNTLERSINTPRRNKPVNESTIKSRDAIAKILAKLKDEYEQKNQQFQQLLARQKQCIQYFDKKAMLAFTQRAKDLGMTPIFDLVLNHLGKDAAFIQEHPEFFDSEDKTFEDATAFCYSRILGSRRKAPLNAEEKEKILARLPQIIETFWQPYINTYINEFKFSGVRVDCIKKIPQELRQAAYALIRQGVKAQDNSLPVVILEEALFSDLSPHDFMHKVKGAGATHITGSVYYRKRLWHGGLEEDYSYEDFYKKSMVHNGVINFTGNHDHHSCAMTVCRELALERLQGNSQLYQTFLAFKHEIEAKRAGGPAPEAAIELLKSIYIHFYVKQIIAELNNPDDYEETVNRFGKVYRDKFLTNALAGSGGYYMLVGDEHASLHQPSVFMRANGEEVYPQKTLKLFFPDSPWYEMACHVVKEMALNVVLARRYNSQYSALNLENREIYLSAFIEQIKNELNANVEKTQKTFLKKMRENLSAKGIQVSNEELLTFNETPLNYQNHWGAPSSLQKFTQPEFFQELNRIISLLPPSNKGYWSELFKAASDDILIAVKINGFGYTSPVDVIIFNLNPDRQHDFEKKDLEKISLWLQQRGFGSQPADHNPDYHRAYGCIMGSAQYQQCPATLYFGGRFKINKDIAEHFVDVGGKRQHFSIAVMPKPEKPDPLLAPAPLAFIPESYTEAQILHMFNHFTVDDKNRNQLDKHKTEPAKANVMTRPKITM